MYFRLFILFSLACWLVCLGTLTCCLFVVWYSFVLLLLCGLLVFVSFFCCLFLFWIFDLLVLSV